MYELQLKWVQQIQLFFYSLGLEFFFKIWAYVDTIYFVLFIIIGVGCLLNRKVGLRLFYLFILSSLFNQILKSWFDLPRPCQIDRALSSYCGSSLGFPSGGAQTAMIVAGVTFCETKRWGLRALSVLFAFLLSLSRVCLGMHYPGDILGGWIVGFFLVLIYRYIFPKMERFYLNLSLILPFPILAAGYFIPAITSTAYDFFWGAIGVALGLRLQEQRILNFKGIWRKLALMILIGMGLGGFFVLGKNFPELKPLWSLGQGFLISLFGGGSSQKRPKERSHIQKHKVAP